MNQALNDCLTGWNSLGRAFCGYAGSTSVQLALLVMLLFAFDVLLRQRVRAVFRYYVWLLVLLKLLLPPTFSLPTGIGYWVGDRLPVATSVSERTSLPIEQGRLERHPRAAPPASGTLPTVQASTNTTTPAAPAAPAVVAPASLTWQAIVLLLWSAGVLAFLALLAQRLRFVRGLVAASTPAGQELLGLLEECARQMGVRRPVRLRTLDTLPSPAVCGLRHPTILLPTALIERLSPEGFQAALIHELAHIKRADLWINAVQTLLQIIYFYNPFVWLANAIIRRTCEEAVDETVLVTLGGQAKNYSNTLIDISEIAFWKADFGLRLVGVAESKRLLQGRIKHMLTRPIPKSARIGTFGTIMVLVVAAVLLPMARGTEERQRGTPLATPAFAETASPAVAQVAPMSVETDLSNGSTQISRPKSRKIGPETTAEPKPFRAEPVGSTPAAGQGPSRAWHIMRQWNCPPLLLGLSQQLAKALEPAQRNGPAWQEVKNGGTLRLKLEIEADQPGGVVVGLFKDARWSAPPVAVRRVSAGTCVLTGLPAGQYQIGAMLGSVPLPVAIGVQRTWPEPVEIKAGQTTTAEVLVSAAFEEQASGWYNEEVAKDYVGDWGRLNEGKLLQGQLTDPAGKPVPFGEIMIREYRTDRRGFAAPNRGTNEQGLYKFDRMAWPYRVMASWRETLPSLFGCRIQTVFLNRVLEGAQRVDFRFEPFPEGTAKLTGRVRDQAGRPVEGFFLRVMTDAGDKYEAKAKAWDQPDEKSYTDTCYEVSFVTKDGSFELGGLPAGAVRVWVIPFEGRRYEHADLKDATLAAGQTATMDFQLTGKDVLYGRVLFEDGTPAVLRPAPWRGAGTRIMPSRGRAKRAPAVSEVDAQGYFAIYLDQAERERFASDQIQLSISLPSSQEHRFETVGQFPADKLSPDKSQAGVVRIKRPESATPVPAEKPRASDGLAASSL
jgi:beta-lactamase regulating signal transducer with metallopeptidase domain